MSSKGTGGKASPSASSACYGKRGKTIRVPGNGFPDAGELFKPV
ncbi:MAG: hypothetical protein ACM3PY_06960 [Omnitrophica WOR_2 bacterium]